MAFLSLSLLGPFAATRNTCPIEGLSSAKAQALLAYLAVDAARPEVMRPHARDELAELLWPERPAGVALGNLRHLLAEVRKSLGDHDAETPYLLVSPKTLQLNPAAGIEVDLAHFLALTARTDRGEPSEAVCREAIALYRGPVLEGLAVDDCPEFEVWLVLLREQADRRMVRTLAHLAGYAVQRRDYAQAAAWTRRQVALEPWNEEAHRQLMLLLALDDQRAAALRQFATCKQLLADELGVAPQPETLALAERIGQSQVAAAELDTLHAATLIRPHPPAVQATAHHLPAAYSAFLGRQPEMAQIAERLAAPECRLLTLLGPGGVGKTRLAVEIAQRHAADYAGGAWFVPLAGVQTRFWVETLLQVLQAPAWGSVEPWQQLRDFLATRHLLLILDNFEHLVDDAGRVAELLDAASALKVLVTSRTRLQLAAEWVMPVAGLELPPLPEADLPPPADLLNMPSTPDASHRVEQYSAIQLFLRVIQRTAPTRTLSTGELQIVTQICRLLGGIPLAIELAAAWVPLLGLPAVLAQLQASLDLLTTTLRDVAPRHSSMRAVFDHSWGLLTPRERAILRQMAVFRGRYSAEAAAAVTGASLAELAALVDKSWLRPSGSGRYELHELIRQYAEERRLEEEPCAGEPADEVRRRHCAYYAGLLHARAHTINLQRSVMGDIMADYGNYLAAWQFAVEHGDFAAAMDMVMAFWFAADMLGAYRFTLNQFEGAIRELAPYVHAGDCTRARRQAAGSVLGWLRYARACLFAQLGLFDRAREEYATNRAEQLHLDLDSAVAEKLLLIDWEDAILISSAGRYRDARRRFRRDLRRFRRAEIDFTLYGATGGRLFWSAHAEAALARMAWVNGRYAVAKARMQRAFALRDQIGEQRYRASNLGLYAQMLVTTGEYATARAAAYRALRLSEQFGNTIGVAYAQWRMGLVATATGDVALAQTYFRQAEHVGRQSGDYPLLPISLIQLGRVELALAHPVVAVRLFEEALDISVGLGAIQTACVVEAILGLGWAAVALHDATQAETLFRQALAAQGRYALHSLEALVGLGAVRQQQGETEQAAALLAYAVQQPATACVTRGRAQALLHTLGMTLRTEIVAAAAVEAILHAPFRLVADEPPA